MRGITLCACAAAFCTFFLLSHTVLAAEHDWGPAPVPRYLIGLWALGHKCNEPGKQLRITAHTMQFGSEPPIDFEYYPPFPGNPEKVAALVPDAIGHAWSYARYDDIIFEYGVSQTEGDIYFRCSARRTGRE